MIERFGVSWHGFLLGRTDLALDGVAHWTRIQGQQFTRYEIPDAAHGLLLLRRRPQHHLRRD